MKIILYICAVLVATPTFKKLQSPDLVSVWGAWLGEIVSVNHTSHIPNQISIPRGTIQTLVCKDEHRQLITLFQLKALYKSNSIHNYRSRLTSLASILGISESKLRKDINYLLREKLAWKESTGKRIDLRLTGKNNLKELLNAPKTNKTHKINFGTSKQTEIRLKALALQQNLNQQTHIIRKKVIDKLGIKRGTKRWQKDLFNETVNKTIDNLRVRSQQGFPNPVTTISRKSIAELLNRTSSNTGDYWVKKFKSLSLITKDERRFKFLNLKANKYNYQELYSEYGGRLRQYKGWLYLIQSNEIQMV